MMAFPVLAEFIRIGNNISDNSCSHWCSVELTLIIMMMVIILNNFWFPFPYALLMIII